MTPGNDLLATVTSLPELDGYEARLKADGRLTAEMLRAVARRRAELSKGAK